jgi:hypothetical protein
LFARPYSTSRGTSLDGIGQPAGLAEVDKVLEGEGEGNRLAEVDLYVLAGLVNVGMLPQLDRSRANVALAAELDALLCALNRDWITLA